MLNRLTVERGTNFERNVISEGGGGEEREGRMQLTENLPGVIINYRNSLTLSDGLK